MHRSSFIAALAVASVLFTGVQAISKITRSGRYLYDQSGNRFYIKGVAYQQQGEVIDSSGNTFLEPSSFIDPLANGTACQRDLPYLQQLSVNTIRAYSVNSSLNHDSCMQAFSNAGIYTIIDLTLPTNGSIDRDSPSWGTNLLDQYIETIMTFSKYDNVLAYNVGNEVVIAANGTSTAPYIKAAARDIKAYLNSQNSSVLVGYASIDGDDTWLDPFANYLSCDPSNSNSGATAIDLYGLNNYQWCGNSTFQDAYAGTEGDYAGYNIPAYFSEYGCITSGTPRPWTEVGALFSSQMSPEWSGGVAFSYFPAASAQGQFGMVTISPDGSSVTTSQDFTNLVNQYKAASPPNSPSQSSAGTTSYPSCPQQNSTFLASTTLPPTPNLSACNCVESELACRFTPPTSNYTALLGPLFGYACTAIGQVGGNCNDISGNGTTGTYGILSTCDPTIQLSYVFNEYYLLTNKNSQSCSFGGNATLNSKAPTSTSAVSSSISSCMASATGTSVPSNGASSSSTTTKNGATTLGVDGQTLWALAAVAIVGVASVMWTLA